MITAKLGDLFTEEQLRHICKLMDEHKDDDVELRYQLAAYFKTFEKELEAKGLLANYAAWAVPYAIRSGMIEHPENN